MSKDTDGDYDTPKTFWSTDLTSPTQARYELSASLRATGKYCLIYVDKDATVSDDQIAVLKTTFDTAIFPDIKNAFGSPTAGKITLLLLDIKDGYVEDGPFTAGFFSPRDLLRGPGSNRCKMLYIDTYPALEEDMPLVLSTIAHEFQHLINYSIRLTSDDKHMDTWIDEGLATGAEYIFFGGHNASRISYFNDNETTIRDGNNFFVWGNHDDSVADYATVYMFFQWLRIHSNDGIEIYKDIINSKHTDFRAVLDAAITHIPALGLGEDESEEGIVNDWGTLLGAWLLANILNQPTGLYGYMGEPDIVPQVFSPASDIFGLLPGEAVYSVVTSMMVPQNSGHIRYIGVHDNLPVFDDYELAPGDTLIAYNTNIDKDDEMPEFVDVGDALPLPPPLPSLHSATSTKRPKSYPVDVKYFLEGHKWK